MWSPDRRGALSFLAHKRGYLFLAFVFFTFMQAGIFAGHSRRTSYADLYPDADPIEPAFIAPAEKSVVKEHPIPGLMADAEAQFRKKVAGQSHTLETAVSEYKRRYGRAPPKGFDLWWKFAQENEVVMVDEFDSLVADLEPFWELSGQELRRRAMQVGFLPSIDLVRVKDGKATTLNVKDDKIGVDVSARATGFRMMLEKFEHTLPDMDFPINAKSEGRVLVPWEHRKYPNTTVQDSSAGLESVLGGPFVVDWRGEGNVWDAWRRTCPPTSPARRLYASVRKQFTGQITNYLSPITGPSEDFFFVPHPAGQIDFCDKAYAHMTQGHFFSDWRTIPAVYPVFSPAKAKGFLDIKIPSHYYYGSTPRYTYGWDAVNLELKDVDPMEIPWEDKSEKIFWRGATTGGGNNPAGFSSHYQRHRFLRMSSDASDSNRTVTFADPPSSSHFVSTRVPIGRLNEEIMDTAFVKPVDAQNYPGGLEGMMRDHRFGDAVPLGKHWAYKYLLDFDGSSYSARFMAFLASDSVPIKATVYEEFFSDWIQPWLHFIPLSASYREIYNIHAFFSGPTQSTLEAAKSALLRLPPFRRKSAEGDRRLRRIARAGKQWKKTMGRPVDMEAYVYRLCLEYARLWADDRDAMGFTL